MNERSRGGDVAKFWTWLARRLGDHAGLVGLIGLVFTIVIGLGVTQLEFATGQDSYLNADSQVYADNQVYQDLFGGQAMLSVIDINDGYTVEDLFTPENQAIFKDIEQRLLETEHVLGVISPLTALEFSARLVASESGNPTESIAGQALLHAVQNAGDEQSTEIRTQDALVTLERTNAIDPADRTLDNPEWVKFLLYDNAGEIRSSLRTFIPDTDRAQMVVRLPGNLGIEAEGIASDTIKEITADLEFDAATITTTGAPVLLKSINDYLRGGMLTLGGIAVAVMIIILLLFFKVRWRLLPLAVVLVGIIWAFGLAGYLGIPLTLVTIAGLPIMLGIGIDYAIQMHSRIEEEIAVGHADEPIAEAARGLGPALLIVTFDAVFAFLAIQISQVPMIRDFGWLLTVGIVAICVSSIIHPLAVLSARESKSKPKQTTFEPGPLGRLVVWLGSVPSSAAIPLMIVAVFLFGFGSYLEPSLKLESDPVNWVNQDSEVIQDIRVVERVIGGSAEIGTFVTVPDGETVFTDEIVAFLDTLARETMVDFEEDLLIDSGIVGTVSKLMDVPGAAQVPPTGELVKLAWDIAPESIQVSTAANDGQALNLVFMTRSGALEDRAEVVDFLSNETSPPAGVKVTASGLAVVGVGLLQNLEENLVALTWVATGLVFLFLLIRLRSFARAILSMVPVLMASGFATIAVYLFAIELSPLTAVGGPLVVATCTEFTSLMLLRYIEERERGYDPRRSIEITAERTGRAFIVSALTAISGVAVIAFSSLPLLSNFGIFIALKVAIALIAALTVLPPLIIWADRREWVSKNVPLDPALSGVVETTEQAPTLDR